MELKTYQTERLILRKLSPEDCIYIFQNHSESEIKALFGHQTEEAFEKEKNKYIKGYQTYNRSFIYFQMIEKTTMQIIGGCGFHTWYQDHHRAEIGYELFEEHYKRKGFMSEALSYIIPYGFEEMNLHRIEAMVGPSNIASLAIMSKYNFTKEGLLRENYLKNSKFEDSLLFSLLKSD